MSYFNTSVLYTNCTKECSFPVYIYSQHVPSCNISDVTVNCCVFDNVY